MNFIIQQRFFVSSNRIRPTNPTRDKTTANIQKTNINIKTKLIKEKIARWNVQLR